MGMPLYGQSFTLANPSEHGLNAPSTGGGTAGEFTRAAGFLSYYEICKNVQKDGWTVVQDETGAMGPYAYKGNQWVSYDDANMIKKKSQLIRDLDLGGGMIWALDLDDFRNTCGQGSYPLLTTIKNVLGRPRIGGDDHDSSASITDTVLTPTPGTKRPTTRPPPKTTKPTTRRPAPSTTAKIPSTKPTKKPTVKTTTSPPQTTAKRPATTARSTTRRPPNKILGTVETEDAIIVGEQESGNQPQKPLPSYPSFPFPAHVKPKEQEADCSSRPFKPHESDCNKYYMCLFGNYAVYHCAPGTYWNKVKSS
jgi:chitinase